MFRNLNTEGRLSDEQRSSSSVSSIRLESQESSWIGLLSRPALSLLRKLRLWNAVPAELGNSLISEESEILRQLNEMMPAPTSLTYLQCQHDAASGLLEPGVGSSLPWLTAASLRDVGVQSSGEMEQCQQTQVGYVSSVRTVLNQVLFCSQELQPAGGRACVSGSLHVKSGPAGKGLPWWGSFLSGEESSERGLLSELSRPEEGTQTDRLCSQPAAQTNVPAAKTSSVFQSTQGEITGPPLHKEEPANNGGLNTVQNTGSCSEGGHPSPEHDKGYFSLEDELSQRSRLSQVKAPSEEQSQQNPHTPEMEVDTQEGQTTSKADHCGGVTMLSTPQCQNKSIAFIMGCPCSDEDSSHTESSEDDDDDDGFDSEGSSDLSDSSDDDDEEDDEASDSDSEPDSESERLWASLCQSVDPYNPRNFTARLHTGSTLPQTIPTSTRSPQSSPVSSPIFTSSSPTITSSPLLTTSSPPFTTSSSPPPSSQDTWDDSTSASEVDEAESLRLLSSFSSSSDPYSPLNFQAPLRTQGPVGSPSKAKVRLNTAPQTPLRFPHHNPSSPPEYRKEEAEERLDSGFSEVPPSTRTQSGRSSKKVRFCDDVEEFFASCGEEEDRRGPWEELARDRCRFLRRCQDVEQSIAYCLQPQHRHQVLQRLLSDT